MIASLSRDETTPARRRDRSGLGKAATAEIYCGGVVFGERLTSFRERK
jgi:hypothetical protein